MNETRPAIQCGIPTHWDNVILPQGLDITYTQALKVLRLHPDAKLPTKATEHAAGFDMYAHSEKPYGSCMTEYGTGIAVEIPVGYVGLIFPRSSISATSLRLANSVGVLDPDYRGELKLRFDDTNLPDSGPPYRAGDRIGQLVILPLPAFSVVEVQELSETGRGQSGFGSTGA